MKAMKVIKSCKTPDQFHGVVRYIVLFFEMVERHDKKNLDRATKLCKELIERRKYEKLQTNTTRNDEIIFRERENAG